MESCFVLRFLPLSWWSSLRSIVLWTDFCIKFCWKNSVCFHQFNNAISHYSRKPWLYDWNRWYSARLSYSWRGRWKSKPLFFYADLAVTFDRYYSGYFRCCFYASCCYIVRCYKRDDWWLCSVWTRRNPFLAPYMLQNVFQSFLIAAEKPNLGLAATLAAGITNMVLDAVLVGVLRWGVLEQHSQLV